ncbi:MAG: MnhB domain-containing protein [Planctomycetes bacterium]|nr:MnhB domain-containing protein [Planctomycetota bacterium]
MKGMTIIVKTISSWVKVLIVLFGIYIIHSGHLSPCGGFAGGVFLASSYLLLMLAFGRDVVERELPPSVALKIACWAAFTFAAIAISGLFFGKNEFFWNYIYQKWLAGAGIEVHFIAAGTISLAEFAIGLLVGALLFLVILNLSTFRRDTSASR